MTFLLEGLVRAKEQERREPPPTWADIGKQLLIYGTILGGSLVIPSMCSHLSKPEKPHPCHSMRFDRHYVLVCNK